MPHELAVSEPAISIALIGEELGGLIGILIGAFELFLEFSDYLFWFLFLGFHSSSVNSIVYFAPGFLA